MENRVLLCRRFAAEEVDMKDKDRKKYHLLMVFLVIAWGSELAVAKGALEIVDPIVILTVKYVLGAMVMAVVLLKTRGFRLLKKRDLGICIICSLVGHILYYFFEYSALETVPVANITILMGFLPVGSVIVEKLLFKRRSSKALIVGMLVCVFGIALTIGNDLMSLGGGKLTGYLMCVGAVGAWLIYLFVTEVVSEDYDSTLIAFYQTVIAAVLTMPYTITHLPDMSLVGTEALPELLYLGLVSEGLCFMIEVKGIQKLGPTISGVYSNFFPVTTAIFGVIMLGQDLDLLQCIGGVVVIVSGCAVIREKSRLEEQETVACEVWR